MVCVSGISRLYSNLFVLDISQDLLQHGRAPGASLPDPDGGHQTLPEWIRAPPSLSVTGGALTCWLFSLLMDLQSLYLHRRQGADSGGPFRRCGDGTFGGLLDQPRAQQVRVRLFFFFPRLKALRVRCFVRIEPLVVCLWETTQELG